MAAGLPSKLRIAEITPFAHRAAQLEKFKPVVSYWCDYYILQQIVKKELHKNDPECEEYAINLMTKLEEAKLQYSDNDAVADDIAAQAYVENFAVDTFERAENSMKANRVTAQTADTFRAAATFIDLMAIWQQPLDPELANKSKYAKYHSLRIVRALKAGEDPNLSNPKQEPPPSEAAPVSPPPLDPNDPEVQHINNLGQYQQPRVESAPHSAPTSPLLPQTGQHHTPMLDDVSPISPPDLSPQKDSTSAGPRSPGGGYFPRVPTFTSEPATSTLPTAPSNDVAAGPGHPVPPSAQQQQQSQLPYSFASDASNDPAAAYYRQPPAIPSSASTQPPSLSHPVPPPRGPSSYAPVPPIPPQSVPTPVAPSYNPHPVAAAHYMPDEEAVFSAQKHAKWAISALNFEDVSTAVRELREALKDLTGE